MASPASDMGGWSWRWPSNLGGLPLPGSVPKSARPRARRRWRPENLVSPGTNEHLNKAIVLTIEDGSVHISEFLCEDPEGDGTLPGLILVGRRGDLLVGVGTPRDGQGAGTGLPFEQ